MIRVSKNSTVKPLIIIPTRGLNSMQRLRKDVNPKMVDLIIDTLLTQTLEVTTKTDLDILVLTSDRILDLSKFDVTVFYDDGKSLNEAIVNGLKTLDYTNYLLIMPDLPGMDEPLIEKIIFMNSVFPYIIVPTHDMGTAIAVLPKFVFEQKLFGPNSASRIIEYCDQNNLPLCVLETQGTNHDLDTVEDLKLWSKTLSKKIPKIKEIVILNQ